MKLRIAATALLAGVLPAICAAQQTGDWNWRGSIPTGGTLEVRGVLGDVSAQRTKGSDVIVTARKHGRRSDPASVEMRVVRSGSKVTICAVYPTPPNASEENDCVPGRSKGSSVEDNDVEVDYTIELPDNITLVASTVVGDVRASDIGAAVDASSVTGKIDVTAAGEVSAKSVSGDIHVRMAARRPSRDLDFQTVSGNITLTVPAQFDADVRLRSQFGDIDSDFDMEIQKSRFGHSSRGRIGAGGATVHASTLSGRIELARM